MYDVSLIIPVYNAEKTLRKCVESIVFGQVQNVEVLLIEDCSCDNSWNLCTQLSQEFENVYCYKNESNKGVSFTRNRGIDLANAPYVMFVDSDDWVSSKYVYRLLESINESSDYMPLCGYTYIDYITETRKTYGCIAPQPQKIDLQDGLLLLDEILIQQLWNKIFDLNSIRNNKVRFDESLNMGEDFDFVLSYIETGKVKKFYLLPEALYYYIRANNTSLMSSWGAQPFDMALERYERLFAICNDGTESLKAAFEVRKNNLKQNFGYHILRNRDYTIDEKKKHLGLLFSENEVSYFYKKQIILQQREKLLHTFGWFRGFYRRTSDRLLHQKNNVRIEKMKKRLATNDFTIISQNCIGGVFYHDLELEFLSPTINAFIPEPDFVKMVQNLPYYMNQDLKLHWTEEYPVGVIDDVEIHFMHYETCSEAKTAWNKRKKRINWDKIFVIGTDRDGFNDEVYEVWKGIPYEKLLFTSQKKYSKDKDSVYFAEYECNGMVPDLIPKREFYKEDKLIVLANRVGAMGNE